MMDIKQLHRELARAILAEDARIEKDAAAFVRRFLASLPEGRGGIPADAQDALTEWLDGIAASIKPAIAAAAAIGAKAGTMSDAQVADLAAQAFARRWPDGLTLSRRLWSFKRETKAGVERAVQDGIRQMKGVGAVVYDMQRAIEKESGALFEIVNRRQDDWVAELADSAKALIRSPAGRSQWVKTVAEIRAHVSQLAETGTRSAAERALAQIAKAARAGNAALVDEAVRWWVYDRQLYHLKRIARTEMADAGHNAIIESTQDDESVVGYQWRLSASHPAPDICDWYANVEMGLGRGVWPKGQEPRHKAHPHCMCLIVPRASPVKQPGSKSYAEFIRGVTPERRAELLPKWAREAVAAGTPLDRLVRADGLGLVTKAAAQPLLNDAAVGKIVERLAEHAKEAESLRAVWANPQTYQKHIDKRVKLGHIADEADYFRKVADALGTANRYNFVDGQYPSVELVSDRWSVILNHDGLIKTAYSVEGQMESFTTQQTRLGHKVYEQDIGAGIARRLGELFRQR